MDDAKLKELKAEMERARDEPTLMDHLRGITLLLFIGLILYWVFWPLSEQSKDTEIAAKNVPPSKQAATSNAPLQTLDAKISKDAVSPMDRQNYPKFYDMLGKSRFDEANALTIWAARAAAESPDCGEVSYVGQSDITTKRQLVWFANCGSGARACQPENLPHRPRGQAGSNRG